MHLLESVHILENNTLYSIIQSIAFRIPHISAVKELDTGFNLYFISIFNDGIQTEQPTILLLLSLSIVLEPSAKIY